MNYKLLCLTLWLAVLAKSTSVKGQCGLSAGAKIVGGQNVSDLRYPWYVALVSSRSDSSSITVSCGGSLITNKHVLTAAHCFPKTAGMKNEQSYHAVLMLKDRCSWENVTRSDIRQVHVNPAYNPSTLYGDVAVATLKQSVPYTTICLPPKNSLVIGEAIIIGFGSTLAKSVYPCIMQEAKVDILSKRQCVHSGLAPQFSLLPGTLCAGVKKGGVDSCDGDSGGPLQTMSKTGIYTIQGIVSFGLGCARKNLPGVYTRVSLHMDFINSVIHSEKVPNPVETREPVSPRIHDDKKWELVKTRVPVVIGTPIILVAMALLATKLLRGRNSLCTTSSKECLATSTEQTSKPNPVNPT